MEKQSIPKRKRNRLEGYDYSTCGAYFLTVCSADRKPLFRCMEQAAPNRLPPLSECGRIVQQAICGIESHYSGVRVDHFCIMPDHIHLILFLDPDPDASAPSVSAIIGQMKRWVSMQVGHSVWQRSFHDTVIRNEAAYLDYWQYIDNNPLKMLLKSDNQL